MTNDSKNFHRNMFAYEEEKEKLGLRHAVPQSVNIMKVVTEHSQCAA